MNDGEGVLHDIERAEYEQAKTVEALESALAAERAKMAELRAQCERDLKNEIEYRDEDSRRRPYCTAKINELELLLRIIDRLAPVDCVRAITDDGLHYTANGIIDWDVNDDVYLVRAKGVE
jgi:uncharacterized coiled-coil protein SlyX